MFRSIPSKNFKSFFGTTFNVADFVNSIGQFLIAVVEYIIYKVDVSIGLLIKFIKGNYNVLVSAKFKLVGKLIWSQGKFGNHIRYIFIISFGIVVFLIGNPLQEKAVIKVDDESFIFLNSDTVLISQAVASTNKGEITLLDAPIEHTVVEGENLVSLGKKYSISVESIKYANNLVSNEVKIGAILKIPPVDGTLHQVKKGDTIEVLSRRYKVPAQTIVDFNYLDSPYALTEGQILTIPNADISTNKPFYAGTPVYSVSAYGVVTSEKFDGGTGKFAWPLSGIITQGFSSYHPGVDIANRSGDIVSSDKGKVIRAGWWQGGYGNAVQVDHGNGYVSTYAHMSTIAVAVGDDVNKGKKLGVVGSTGRSTGPHVHFTIQFEGKYINPLDVLPR